MSSNAWGRLKDLRGALQGDMSACEQGVEARLTDFENSDTFLSNLGTEEDDFEYTDEIDEDDENHHLQLLTAQQQWEESIEQLGQALNWVLLPLLGKFLGRRTALKLWRHAMDYLWRA
ncbi:LAMI_0H16072g1_1 [Lachancea mirantina]|uniref:LAMI_0H16072g1_1 n=1 Tax=Lachancea mirantina TaxID=1230905 RepID=A0A1G4KIP8_9SACH|nr:LAMI_0H16072g1_1 [Lachancea mirantina]